MVKSTHSFMAQDSEIMERRVAQTTACQEEIFQLGSGEDGTKDKK